MQTEQHFLIEQVLQQSEKATLNPETAKKLQVIKKEHNDKPVIFVGRHLRTWSWCSRNHQDG
jgi:tRNA G26 N,N-dimethylase Trm1